MAGKKITKKSWRHRRWRHRRAKLAQARTRSSTTTSVQGSRASHGDPQAAEQESGKTSATTKLDPKGCAIYTRTCTTRVQGSSSQHQISQIATKVATKDITIINDCTSGMLPDHRQQRLVDIITSGKFQKVFVEGTHVLSRQARVAEDVATIASKHGVQLIPGDSLVDSPVNSPGRKAMMAAVMKFETDKTHKCMTHGREAMI